MAYGCNGEASLMRGEAATETRMISRKDAKAQRSDDNGETFLIDYSSFPSELGGLCALARVNPRVRVQVSGKFSRAAKTFKRWRRVK